MQAGIQVQQRLITPDERLDYIPFPPAAGSFQLGWSGLRAEHFRMTLNHELHFPPMAQHLLILYQRPPDEMSLKNEDLTLSTPPSPGSVAIIPAGGSSTQGFWRGSSDAVHVQLDPQLIARVAVEAFDLDPDRVELPTVYDLSHPQLQAAILAIDAELAAGVPGGRLLAESLGNVLAVNLIRHITGNERAAQQPRGGLPKNKLRAAMEYIDAHLDSELTLDQLAAVAHLSSYHFARMFKVSTGLPPHQFVIARRVDRAKRLLRGDDELSLAQVASRAGFFDQGHFTRHFKRLVGVTPKQFR
jgi:AraC family transcriptional regulator